MLKKEYKYVILIGFFYFKKIFEIKIKCEKYSTYDKKI